MTSLIFYKIWNQRLSSLDEFAYGLLLVLKSKTSYLRNLKCTKIELLVSCHFVLSGPKVFRSKEIYFSWCFSHNNKWIGFSNFVSHLRFNVCRRTEIFHAQNSFYISLLNIIPTHRFSYRYSHVFGSMTHTASSTH